MKGTFVTKIAVLAVLALMALTAVQSGTARTLPISEVAAPTSLARIQHPGGISDLARFESFRGGPTGVYVGRSQVVVIPWSLSRIRQPDGVYVVTG